MTLNIELDQELETRLIAGATLQGVALEEYARNLIRQAVQIQAPPTQASQEEFSAFLDALAAKGSTNPALANETFSREFIYDDHD
jgi:hypothetical protein